MNRTVHRGAELFEIPIGNMILSVLDTNRLPDGDAFSPHEHAMLEFQYVTNGNMFLRTSSECFEVNQDCFALIPQGRLHWTEYDRSKFSRYALLFSISRASANESGLEYEHYGDTLSALNEILCAQNETVTHIMKLLTAQAPSDETSHLYQIYFSLIFTEIAAELSRRYPSAPKRPVHPITSNREGLRGIIAEYLSNHYRDENPYASLSRYLYMSERNTRRTVKRLFGVPLSHLVLEKRMQNAHTYILETDQPLSRIAEAVGYRSYSAFYKAFRSYFGHSPESAKETR